MLRIMQIFDVFKQLCLKNINFFSFVHAYLCAYSLKGYRKVKKSDTIKILPKSKFKDEAL